MHFIPAKIAEVKLHLGESNALISCPEKAVPAAGQYVLGVDRKRMQAVPLFNAGVWEGGFLAAPPVPASWLPGTQLSLFGPLGNGFRLPGDVQRLALIGLGDTMARLLPLATNSQAERLNITLFSNAPLNKISPDLEAFPLNEIPEALTWADFFAIDSPPRGLDQLGQLFRTSISNISNLRGQVLIQASMPCCGLGRCGVCAMKVGRSWKLTCEDGPVFELQDILKGISL